MRTFSWEHFGRFVMVGSNKTYAEVDTEQRPPSHLTEKCSKHWAVALKSPCYLILWWVFPCLEKKKKYSKINQTFQMLSEWQKQPFWWLRQSPNYRITELRKDLWRSSCPTSLLKEESIRVGHPGPCPVKFLVSPGMVTLWATCFSVSPQTVKKFSSIFKCNFLFCNLCLLFLVLSLNITVNLSLSSLHSLIRYLYALIRFFSAFSSLS